MKKALKITLRIVLAVLALALVAFLLVRFVFHKQLAERLYDIQYRERVALLRDGGEYAPDTLSYRFRYLQDTVDARRIREYFRLDTLTGPAAATWDRALALARFVARNIPHANQQNYPQVCTAVGLWEYTRTVEPAFNCRLHAILLHELLLAEGITNRFVTCLPADSLDHDCHVVNVVWLPERQKWAMLDSDMQAWAEDETGTPLSLAEMREHSLHGCEIVYRPLLDREKDFDYYRAYWAKNLYWFECWETTGYGRENNNPIYAGRSRIIALLPPGFGGFSLRPTDVRTSDDGRFWAAPESLTTE